MKKWASRCVWFLTVIVLSGCTASSPIPASGPTSDSSGSQEQQPPTLTASPPSAVMPLGPGGGGAFDVFAFSPEYVYVGTDIGGIFRSANHGETWRPANRGLYDYMINDIAVNPAKTYILYAATPGGVYKTVNRGDQWHLMSIDFPPKESNRYSAEIGAVALDPSNPEIVFAGIGDIRQDSSARGNGDMYKSTDGGITWNKVNVGNPAAGFYEIVVDPLDGDFVYAAAGNGFFRSMDGGHTWTQIDDRESRGLVAGVDTSNLNVVLYRAAWSAGIYKSEDRGLSWKKLNIPSCRNGCRFYRIVLDPADVNARTVYVGDYGDWNKDQGVFVTADGGESWKQINLIESLGWVGTYTVTRVRSLGINPYDPNELYYGHSMGIYKRYATGNWKQVFTTLAKTTGGTSTVWAGTWSGRYNINNTQANTKPMFHPSNHDEYYLGFADLYIWKTGDNGASWENIQIPGDNDVRALAADPNDGTFQTWFAGTSSQQCCSGELYKTTDAGQTWEKASGLPGDRIWDIAIVPGQPDTIYAATNSRGLYRSTDGGRSFVARNGSGTDILPMGSIYHIALDTTDSDILHVSLDGDRGGVFKSADGGGHWQEAGDLSDCYAVAVSPLEQNEIFAGCGLQLYKSEDGGASWDALFEGWEHPLHPGTEWGGAHIRDIALHPADPKTLCFVIKDDPYHDQASGGGLYCTLNSGAAWRELAADLGLLLRGVSVAFHPLLDPRTGTHDLFYMTGGNGAYKIPGKFLVELLQGQ